MQLLTSKSIKFFDEMFRKKFGFEKYENINKPTIFFGVYNQKDIQNIINHKNIKIIWFAGSDSMNLETLLSLKELQNQENTVFVAESSWIRKDLDNVGIKYESISLFLDNIYRWGPVPLGDSLFFYNANSSKYGKQYLSAIKEMFPDLNIITNDAHAIPREKIHEVYARCFAGVRPVEHDGTSMSTAEMALMGRMSIYNGDGPFSVPFKGQEGLIEAIRRLRVADYNYRLVAKRARSFFIEGEIKWCNLVLRLCGTDELDIAHIFDEDSKRSASFFRIMRKEVIDKLPEKFGSSQYERPYMVEQLNKLGLKKLICSKNSGFVAREFKNDGNKGYGKINNYFTNRKIYN